MKPGDKIAVMLGMTRTEIAVISSLLLFLFLGFAVNGSRSFQEAAMVNEKEQNGVFTDAEVDSLLREAELLEAVLARKSDKAVPVGSQRKPAAAVAGSSQKVVFSNATVEELGSIPGISSVLAGRLIVFRNSRTGKVERFQDFLEVKGIGSKRMETLKQHLILD